MINNKNQDGFITKDEFIIGLDSSLISEREWQSIFKEIDQDGSGKVDSSDYNKKLINLFLKITIDELTNMLSKNAVASEVRLRSPSITGGSSPRSPCSPNMGPASPKKSPMFFRESIKLNRNSVH